MPNGVTQTVVVCVGVLTIVTLLYVIRDRRASIFKSERDAERGHSNKLTQDLGAVTAERDELLNTRTLEPVLALVTSCMEQVTLCATNQAVATEKLASLNGTLKHIETGFRETAEGLHDATNAMRTVIGTLAELHDIPLKPKET